ncbi:HalOD1 output domain-containing protein [Halorubrum sp. 48-1-W]|uniref:HalOD1 output domain-containing protein n=1 Tax=Halorubrum sp. 48-1-W TaxID=2249761 RepID=UPI0013003155|nr:HalOD1 output domain-containing protein [Halorubrum sp. 48-1-W]
MATESFDHQNGDGTRLEEPDRPLSEKELSITDDADDGTTDDADDGTTDDADDGTTDDADDGTYLVKDDADPPRSLTVTIVRAIATLTESDPASHGPLTEWIDPDSLEELFAKHPQTSGSPTVLVRVRRVSRYGRITDRGDDNAVNSTHTTADVARSHD